MTLHDKPNCRVYPSGTDVVAALLGVVPCRLVDVVKCFLDPNETHYPRRYGQTTDGKAVEVFEGMGDDWFAIECEQ